MVIYLHSWIDQQKTLRWLPTLSPKIAHARRAYKFQAAEAHIEQQAERLNYCPCCTRYFDDDPNPPTRRVA